jgi:hypothetical protein
MTNQHPRLRRHIRKRANGSVKVYWFFDRRPEGLPDVPLGTDYEKAKEKWRELYEHKPRIAGTLQEAFEAWEKEALPAYTNADTRKNYGKSLRKLKPVFGPSTWDAVQFGHLKGYLRQRSAKTQANREMALLSVIWNWARGTYHEIPWPAAGMERSKWKNKEHARRFEVTDALFAAVYSEADQTLRDAMDLATATGLRLTDVRRCLMPSGAEGSGLVISAAKTGKRATFEIPASSVLTSLVERRRSIKADHLMLLSTPSGRPVSATMLRDRYDLARAKAAARPENAAIADQIRAMYLRDCRKRASDLAGSVEEASKLLQHSSVALTGKHYRTKATKLTPVR